MTARILVVDDLLPNIKLLEARLLAEYFEVLTATSGARALEICAEGRCDIVLLDVMMPGMDGFETCKRLKANPATADIPVVMVTALDQPTDRVRGLEAGADDFLTKPVDELALLARVRSLARLKVVVDDLRARADTSASFGIAQAPAAPAVSGDGGLVLLVEDRASSADRISQALVRYAKVEVEKNAQDALFKCAENNVDLVCISLSLENFDALRLVAQIRSLERTRQLPILLIAEMEERDRVLRGLDMGVNDYLMRPIDRNELVARVRTQVRRKRYADSLRETLTATMELAVVDPLTGLHNRRYFESHLEALTERADSRGEPISLMVLDIDHFKSVNDQFGHDAGDEILKGFANRVKAALRGADLMCRMGGEEFIVVMPDTGVANAERVAERLRATVERAPFPTGPTGRAIRVTVSIGLAERPPGGAVAEIIKRADTALYRSKSEGRNRVSAAA